CVAGNAKRVLVLVSLTAASYLLMALEGWVILRASGTPIAANAALAVETFSRVSSFASAFIPANLGALEASSFAAVIAVGAAGGGAAPALALPLRGVFWGGGGGSARACATPAGLVLGRSRTGDLSAPGSCGPRSRRCRRDIERNAGNAALLSRRAVCVS